MVIFLRIVLGALFIFSGAMKLRDPMAFYDAVNSFRLLEDPLISLTVLAVPCFEIIVGLLVVFGVWARTAMTFYLGSLVVFTALILLSWMRGLDISCGCFGGSGDTNYPVKVLTNVAHIVMASWVWWREYLREEERGQRSVETPI